MSDTDWASKVSAWQDQVSSVPVRVSEDIRKGRMKPEEAARGLQSLMYDPLSSQYAMGFKDRRQSLSYDMLKTIPHQLAVIAAILQVRCNQVAAFSVPYRNSKSIGFQIKHKDPSHPTTKSEVKFIKELETFIYQCGYKDPNPHSNVKRDDFETFLKKLVRDSLTFDQACIEIVPDRRGEPYEFVAVDASTMRIAASNGVFGPNQTYHPRAPGYSGAGAAMINPENSEWGPYRALKLYNNGKDTADYVQVVNGQVVNVYSRGELAFGVRNPRTDIYVQGYGYGELEQLVTIITAHLHAEEYNRRFFINGSAPKGILNFKGDSMTPDMLEGFKRQWRSTLEGVSQSWKTPILQSEQGVDWIDLHPSNREMEYNQWIEYLIKTSAAVYLIDPAELNFDLHGGVSQTPLFESSQEWKLKASRDKGLRPLLRFIAKLINEHIISKIDDRFILDFVGLDELTQQEKHTLLTEQVSSYRTLNEIRREDDKPDLKYGNMPMNPVYLQAMQIAMQQEQAEQQQQQQPQGGSPGGGQGGAPQEQDTNAEMADDGVESPEYSDSFGKALSVKSDDGKYLEIDLSSLDRWKNASY